jgi:hypothetical protein
LKGFSAVGDGGGAGVQPQLANGDVNGDSLINLSDAVYLLNWLFKGGEKPVAIECNNEPPPDTARFRVLNVLVCGQQAFPATLSLCGVNAADSSDANNVPSDCTQFNLAANCPVRVSANTAQCGSFALCGDIAPVKNHVYDFVVTATDAGELLLIYFDQALDAQGNCPTFPPGGTAPTGVFRTNCPQGLGAAQDGGGEWRRADW